MGDAYDILKDYPGDGRRPSRPGILTQLKERDAIIDALLARGLRHTTDCPVGKASYDNPDTCRCGLTALRARIEEIRK